MESALSFYGTKTFPYDEIIVYIFSAEETQYTQIAFAFHNTVLLPVENKENMEDDLGVIMHEIAHAIYRNQETALQYDIEKFFFQESSQYAYIAYQHLNEALATTLGNGLFMEKLTGQPSMSYTNAYVQGFAQAIYGDVKAYLHNSNTMDEGFLKQVTTRFMAAFPTASNHLQEVLARYVILAKHFEPQEVAKTFNKHFKANSHFLAVLDDKQEMEADIHSRYYDHNAPVVFILSQEEAQNLQRYTGANPYLKNVSRAQLKSLQRGFNYFRDRQKRLYLFFVVANYTELEKLLSNLQERQYIE